MNQPQQDRLTSAAPAPAGLATTGSTSPSPASRERAATVAFRKTISLNNVGVHHMDMGEPAKAARALTNAFYAFKKAYYKQKHDLPSLFHQQQPEQEAEGVAAVQSLLLNVDDLFSRRKRSSHRYHNHHKANRKCSMTFEDMEHQQEEEEPEEVTVYSNPIYLPTEYPITQESCGFLSTSITFNLALANHLCGLDLWEQQQQQKPQEDPSELLKNNANIMKHLLSAGRLYEYTIRLERARSHQQQQQRASAAASYNPSSYPALFVSPFVLMAILNNLGHLHVIMQNETQSEKCFRQLQSTLMYMLQFQNKSGSNTNGRTSANSTNHQSMIQVFMENASLGLRTTRMTAAAA